MVGRSWSYVVVTVLMGLVAAQPSFADTSSRQPEVAWYLRGELKKHNIGEDTQSLMLALDHKEPSVRWIVAREMGVRKVSAALPQLKTLLEDGNSVVRSEAAGALLEMGDQTGIPILKAMLDSKLKWDFVTAARILAAHGDDSGLGKVRPLLRSPNAVDRCDALQAFAASNDPNEALPALRQGINDEDGFNRSVAMNALGKKATPEAIEIIAGLLESPRKDERRMAAMRLNWMHKADSIPFLIGALSNDDAQVRETAVLGVNYLAGRKLASSTKKSVRDMEDAKRLQSEWRQWWDTNKATFVLGPAARPQYAD